MLTHVDHDFRIKKHNGSVLATSWQSSWQIWTKSVTDLLAARSRPPSTSGNNETTAAMNLER